MQGARVDCTGSAQAVQASHSQRRLTCACGRMNLRSSSANHLGSAVSWLRRVRRKECHNERVSSQADLCSGLSGCQALWPGQHWAAIQQPSISRAGAQQRRVQTVGGVCALELMPLRQIPS